ncbi:putative membrane protein SpoIIM required for sporulation [Caulobacter ginsengisoli]|uniref:Membrane protein SpoIIM required for sporulation n=1 Tax=Caulobacter ginsengisoli TaxID=400775 RepID=A0ABU0IUX1_9CAUL|nr:stage II sporulation protein M [Caulobacter ginsengisoli]MDQ0465813.1 putative membrane protein SpoIIM required for sporulation [Caulobacter ginsengisoli]
MAELQLKSRRFRAEREWDWRRLEFLLKKAEGQGARGLTDEELLAVPVLYRGALSALSVARATSLDVGLTDYLESLCTRAYFFVYGTRTRLGERIANFFTRDWPRAVQSLWRETLVALAIFAVSAVAAYMMVSADMDWFDPFMGGMSQGRDPTATTEFLRSTLYHDGDNKGLSGFASFLFTHNAQVAIFCFALGFAFCLPTAALLATTGLQFGAFLALFASRELGPQAAGWLLIHGTTELFAIILAGAAGFRIGWRLIFPGEKSRIDAAAEAGRTAGTVMGGVLVMLFCAGVLEGLGRQLILIDWIRFAIAGGMLTLWLVFYYLPRRWRPTSVHD